MYAHAASPDPLGYISSSFNRAKRDQKLALSFIRTAATFSTSRPPRSAYRCRRSCFSCTFSAHRKACFSMKASTTHNRGSSRGQANESGSSIRRSPAFTEFIRLIFLGFDRQGNQRCWFHRVVSGVGRNSLKHLWRKCQEYRRDLSFRMHFVEGLQYRPVQVIRWVRFLHHSEGDGSGNNP